MTRVNEFTYSNDKYRELREFIGNRGTRKLAGNTYARIDGDAVVVKYHQTDIATLRPDSVTINNGGWFTSTTKERLNTFCLPRGWSLFQRNHEWFLLHRDGIYEPTTYEYENGATIFVSGEVAGLSAPDDRAKAKAAARAMVRRINKYAALYTNEVLTAMVETAQANNGAYTGDCFYCAMTATGDKLSLGDSLQSYDHLEGHIEESYLMLSLALNAVKERGYGWPAVILAHSPDIARKAIKTYLRKRLVEGLAS